MWWLYQNQTHKILHWKIKVIVFYIVAGFIIAYPFFSIKYFETFVALKMTLKFSLTPIVILLLLFGPKFYYKKIKPLDTSIPKSRSKEKARDIFAMIMAIIWFAMIFCGIAFSLVITTNKFLGKSEIVKIREPVEKYEPYITKYGRLRHYIDFKNPRTNNTIHLEVYRRYNVGETFEKEMNYGFWGILYSTK